MIENYLLYNPFGEIPKSEKSYARGWFNKWAADLQDYRKDEADVFIDHNDNIFKFDIIFLCFDMYFSDKISETKTMPKDLYERLNNLIRYQKDFGDIILLGKKSEDFVKQICNEMYLKLLIGKKDERFSREWLYDVSAMFSRAKTVQSFKRSSIIVGDTHSLAFARPEDQVHILKSNFLSDWFNDPVFKSVLQNKSEISLCLGSYDIRYHHFYKDDIVKLADKYAKYVIEAQEFFETAINVCAPVPVEFEGRKIPKKVMCKNSFNMPVPFSMSRQERLDNTKRFIERLDMYCTDFDMIIPPYEWYQMDGEAYSKKYMEMGGGIHIAPKYFRNKGEW